MSVSIQAFQAAQEHHRLGELPQAVALYEAALKADPNFADAVLNLGMIKSILGDAVAAEAYFQKAIDLEPNHTTAKVALGDLFLNNGNIAGAIQCYQQALEVAPGEAGIYNNLGRALLSLSKIEEAVNFFETALSFDPLNPNYHFNLATALAALGRFETSIKHFKKTLRDRPEWPQAHFGLAVAYGRTDQNAAAIAAFRKGRELQPQNYEMEKELAALLIEDGAIDEPKELLQGILEAWPEDSRAHFMAATIARRERRFEDAVICHQRAMDLDGDALTNGIGMANALLKLDHTEKSIAVLQGILVLAPDYAEAWNSLGNAWLQAGEIPQALEAYEKSLKFNPASSMAATNLALAFLQAGEADKAMDQARANVAQHPDSAEALRCLGTVLLSLEHYQQALAAFDRALENAPDDLDTQHNRAAALHRLERYGEAIDACQAIIARDPQSKRSRFNLGTIFQVLSRHNEAIEIFEQLLEIDPDYTAAWSLLAFSLNQECRWADLPRVTENVIRRTRQEIAAGSNISTSPFSLLQLCAPGDVRLASARQSARAAELLSQTRRAARPFEYAAPPPGKLRIGYISPDFRNHSLGRAFQALIAAHDRDRFEFHGYSTASHQDELTKSIAGHFDSFVDLGALPFADAAARINQDGINVLIDLAGHTRGSRLEILAERPAPVQVHYLGYGNTIGADYVDWLITDEVRTPAAELPWCHEDIVYLPDSVLPVFGPPLSPNQTSRADHGLLEDSVVFANFNGHYKFDQKIFASWMNILRQMPKSVLWLMEFKGNSSETLKREAHNAGIDPNRLIFAPRCSNSEHLSRLALADLALDTYRHAGGVTTTDALWAGVPVLTLLEDNMVDRMGASLMSAAHLPELIASSLDDYVARAVKLAQNPTKLDELRQKLAAHKQTAPLFDTPCLARHMEQAFEAIWKAASMPEKPSVIRVG